ncbi:MAG: DegV family protein, partial [Acidimicrobiia bacterium]
MTIGIVTDSSCDLPTDVARRHGIGIVPLTIRFGDEAIVDGADLDSSAFWQRLERSPQLPETAAPSPGAFLDAFGRLGDVDGVVCLCLSSRLSATYQAAVLAAEESELRVKVIDSEVVSMALGLVAINAAEVARTGAGLEAVAFAAAQAAARSNVFAALDTLEY